MEGGGFPMSDVPVLLTVFNRVDLTRIMLDALRKMRPPILFIAADGPRPGNATDPDGCAQVRKDLETIEWPCQINHLYSDSNLGCGKNVSGAITKVLEDFDRLVVLEDDCVPAPSFLPFCAELLERYQADTRISMVCASLPLDFVNARYSYFFSRSYSCWGWATWRRAWEKFDYDMKSWPSMREFGLLRSRFSTEYEYRVWSRQIDRVYESERRAWAAQWGYACRQAGGLAAFSHRSLISNTGIGNDLSTHGGNRDFCSIWTREIGDVAFPLRHQPCVLPDLEKERAVRKAVATIQRPLARIRARIKATPSLLTDMGKLIRDYYDLI